MDFKFRFFANGNNWDLIVVHDFGSTRLRHNLPRIFENNTLLAIAPSIGQLCHYSRILF